MLNGTSLDDKWKTALAETLSWIEDGKPAEGTVKEFIEIILSSVESYDAKILALFSFNYYRNSKLKFYNLDHVVGSLKSLRDLTDNFHIAEDEYAGKYDELIVVLCYGKAIYVPGDPFACGPLSAACYDYSLKQLQIKYNDLFFTHSFSTFDLITALTLKGHLSEYFYISKDLGLLFDADLSYLAKDWSSFLEDRQNQIIDQSSPDEKFNAKQLVARESAVYFLSCKKEIYRTEKGRELYEDAARQNIADAAALTFTI